MKVFLYKLHEDKLVPSDNGDVIVIVDNSIVRVFDKNGDELKDKSFAYLSDEEVYLRKIKELEKVTNIKVDPAIALAYPDIRSRRLKLNQIIGYLFEEYVYNLLSRKYNVFRSRQTTLSLPKFGIKKHNMPDFIVENKIAIEAKTGDYDISQIIDYEKYFPIGAIVFPWSHNCKMTKWRCFSNLLKDSKKLIEWIDIYLTK